MLNLSLWNIVWTVVNVLVLFLALKKFLFQPVMNIIQTRQEMIQKQFENAKNKEEEAEQNKLLYQEKMKDAHNQADAIITKAKAQAEDDYKERMIQAKEDSDHLILKARSEIEQEQERAKEEVKAQIAELAVAAARKIMKTGDFHDTASNK